MSFNNLIVPNSNTIYASLANVDALIVGSATATKGDILVCNSSGKFVRLAVGTNGQKLTANSAVSLGVEWA